MLAAGGAPEEKKGGGGMTAEQRRLNPMAAAAAGGGGLTAEQKRLNPLAGLGGSAAEKGKALAAQAARQAVQNTIKRGVTKVNFDNEFKQKSFKDSRDKII